AAAASPWTAEAPCSAPLADPWDFWIFGVSLRGGGYHEDQSSNSRFGLGLSDDRTTEGWKLEVDGSANFSRSEFQLTDSTAYEDERNTWSVSASAVRSLGDHRGLGAEMEGSNSVSPNRDLPVGLGTGIEWDDFPYAESTRRSLLAKYVVNVPRPQLPVRIHLQQRREHPLPHRDAVAPPVAGPPPFDALRGSDSPLSARRTRPAPPLR
ncbi:MAG TPA: hypothetical protein VE173_04030, partial [Longimicrobiales bacterium]|nr:hypothetical protein [Longimicrobiales bacterium]